MAAVIDIHADKYVECRDDENVCIAEGKAWVKNGEVTIWADQLKIYFKNQGKNRQLIALEAIGNAKLHNQSGTVLGDHIWYWDHTKTLEATGKNVSLRTESFQLTACKSIRYSHLTHQGKAVGKVYFKQGNSYIRADNLLAFFEPKTKNSCLNVDEKSLSIKNESLTLKSVQCEGNVSVFRDDQMACADRGVYDEKLQQVHLWGNVSIMQGKNFAKGNEAIFYTAQKRVVLCGNRERVNFLLLPEKFKLNHK